MKKLKISDEAITKLRHARDTHKTEVGGWFVSSSEDDLFKIESFYTVKQECTSTTVEFDDDDNCRFVEEMSADEIYPIRCQKIWVHTHPGNCAKPSSVDVSTFKKMTENLSVNDWRIMFILAMDDSCTCRIAFRTELGIIEKELQVSFMSWYDPAWDEEFEKNVHIRKFTPLHSSKSNINWKPKSNLITPQTTPPIQPRGTHNITPELNFTYLDLPEILLKYSVDNVSQLRKKELKKILNQYCISKLTLINAQDDELKDHEETNIQGAYYDILNTYNIQSLDELDSDLWIPIVEYHLIRKKTFLDFERDLGGVPFDPNEASLGMPNLSNFHI